VISLLATRCTLLSALFAQAATNNQEVTNGIPMISITAGIGITPFQAFLQQPAIRIGDGENTWLAVLIYGRRHPAKDYLKSRRL
jgi:sulfite reductase alpha subunit-like flavoprotein